MGLGSMFGTQQAITSTSERGDEKYDLEGVVIDGSWDPVNGTVQVQEGASYSVFGDSGDQPMIITAMLINPSKGQQGPPVGGERATCWQSQSGWKATLENSYDESHQTPAGEWWQVHVDANGQIDAFYKIHNDAFNTGDAQASHEILSGAKHSQTTAGGLAYVARDDTNKIGVGKDPSELNQGGSIGNNASRQSDMQEALENYVRTFVGNVMLQYTRAIVQNGGLPTAPSAEALFGTILGGGFPGIDFLTKVLPNISGIGVPNCSNIVLIE